MEVCSPALPVASNSFEYPFAFVVEFVRVFAPSFWKSVEEIFGDMLVNHAANPINETSIANLVAANQRAVV